MWLINHLIVICITHSKYFAISDYCSLNPLTNSSQALGAYHIIAGMDPHRFPPFSEISQIFQNTVDLFF